MYTLPSNVRITIRKVDKPLRAFVQACRPGWLGDKVSVIITDRVEKSSSWDEFIRYDFATGTHAWIPQFDGRRQYIAIALDEAIVKPVNRYDIHGHVTIHLHGFTTDDNVELELEVARDALLEGDVQNAQRIAKQALPHGYGLFEALVRHELKVMPRFLIEG